MIKEIEHIPIKIKPAWFNLSFVFIILFWLIIASNNITLWVKLILLGVVFYLLWFRQLKYVYVKEDSFLIKSHLGFICKEIKFHEIGYVFFNKPPKWGLDVYLKVFYSENKYVSIDFTSIDIIDKVLPHLIRKQVKLKVGDSLTALICYKRALKVAKSDA